MILHTTHNIYGFERWDERESMTTEWDTFLQDQLAVYVYAYVHLSNLHPSSLPIRIFLFICIILDYSIYLVQQGRQVLFCISCAEKQVGFFYIPIS